MSGVISAIVVLLIIGAVAALILVIASKYMSVPENEMFPAIRECLPGANCGACGYAGCDGYAKALAEGEETKTNLCVPGADGAAAAIIQQNLDKTHSVNDVTSIVFDFRGYDTMGEAFILITAVAGSAVILFSKKSEKEAEKNE